jgi:hypothetical protein
MIYVTSLHIIDNKAVIIKPFEVEYYDNGYHIILEEFNTNVCFTEDVVNASKEKLIFFHYSPEERRCIELYEMLSGVDFERIVNIAVSSNYNLVYSYYSGILDMTSCAQKIFMRRDNV